MKYAANDKKFTSGRILYKFETFSLYSQNLEIIWVVKLTFIICLLILWL